MLPAKSRPVTDRDSVELRHQLRSERAELRHATRTLLDETHLRISGAVSGAADRTYLQLVLEFAAAVTEHLQLAAFADLRDAGEAPPLHDTERPPRPTPAVVTCLVCRGDRTVVRDGEQYACPACAGVDPAGGR